MLNIVKNKKIFFIISAVLVIASIASLLIQGFNLDTDFAGGIALTVHIDKDYDIKEIERLASEALGSDRKPSSVQSSENNNVIIKFGFDQNLNAEQRETFADEKITAIREKISEKYGINEITLTATLNTAAPVADVEKLVKTNVLTPMISSFLAKDAAPAADTATTEAPATEAPATEAPATEAPATEAPATEAPATEAPATEAPATETPATEAPATEAPATEAPATEAPATEAPATEAPATEAPATEAPAVDPEVEAILAEINPTITVADKTVTVKFGTANALVEKGEKFAFRDSAIENIKSALEQSYGIDTVTSSNDFAGIAKISPDTGIDLAQSAVMMSLLAALAILVYITIRFEFTSGVCAVLTLAHDIIILCGIYSIFRIAIDTNFIAALLTVLGYSINATIIVFDRIRENTRHAKKQAYAEITNTSINQTITRSINTTVTTLLTIGMVYILGVTSIKIFAMPIIIGILIGTYSSICIAGPLWSTWKDLAVTSKANKK